MKTTHLFAALLLASPFVPLGAQETVAFSGVSLVDVQAGEVLPDRTVVVRGERIEAVGPSAGVVVPEGARVVDGRGLFLMPGLFDVHVHFADPDTFGPLAVAHGVTFVRDMGGTTERVLSIRARAAAGQLLGPEMAVTGAILDGEQPVWPFSIACRTPEEGRKAVADLVEAGVDQLKVYDGLDAETYRAILEEARRLGRPVVGHVPRSIELEEAFEAGQVSIEHLTGFDVRIGRLAGKEPTPGRSFAHWLDVPDLSAEDLDSLAKRVAASGAYLCPTLVVYERIGRLEDPALLEDPSLAFVPASLREAWKPANDFRFRDWTPQVYELVRKALGEQMALVGRLHAAGGRIVAGTDLSNPYLVAGASLHEELRLLAASGLRPVDALRSATTTAAALCGVADRLGTVEAGKTASMVLLAADPLEDVANVSRVAGVVLRGRYLDRGALDEIVAGVKASVAEAAAPLEEALELPGEVVARGRYRMTWGGRYAGEEDFLVTRDEGGWWIGAADRPAGGFQQPSRTVLRVDSGFEFVSATWKQGNVEAGYSRLGDRILTEASRGGEKEEPAIRTLPSTLVVGPTYVGDSVLVGGAKLPVGGKKAFRVLFFGYPSWQVEEAGYELERLPDDEGRPRYRFVLETTVGPLTGELWTDDRGVPVRKSFAIGGEAFEVVREDR